MREEEKQAQEEARRRWEEEARMGQEDERARNYIYQIEGKERELGLIMLDHSYSKPFNWRPEIGFGAKPTRYLFASNEPRAQGATSPTQM